MENTFIVRLSRSLFEPDKKNSSRLRVTDESVTSMDAINLKDLYLRYLGDIIEDGVPVGVRIWCDLGNGYGFDNHTKIIEMRPGDTAEFSYHGTSVDDEGDPDDFSIYYCIELLDWDDKSPQE